MPPQRWRSVLVHGVGCWIELRCGSYKSCLAGAARDVPPSSIKECAGLESRTTGDIRFNSGLWVHIKDFFLAGLSQVCCLLLLLCIQTGRPSLSESTAGLLERCANTIESLPLSTCAFSSFGTSAGHLRVFIFWHLCWSRDVAVILTRALLVIIEGGRWVPSYPFSLMPDSNP